MYARKRGRSSRGTPRMPVTTRFGRPHAYVAAKSAGAPRATISSSRSSASSSTQPRNDRIRAGERRRGQLAYPGVSGRVHVRQHRRVERRHRVGAGHRPADAELLHEAAVALHGLAVRVVRRDPARLAERQPGAHRSARLQLAVRGIDVERVVLDEGVVDDVARRHRHRDPPNSSLNAARVVVAREQLGAAVLDRAPRLGMGEHVELPSADRVHDARAELVREPQLSLWTAVRIAPLLLDPPERHLDLLLGHRPAELGGAIPRRVLVDTGVLVVRRAQHRHADARARRDRAPTTRRSPRRRTSSPCTRRWASTRFRVAEPEAVAGHADRADDPGERRRVHDVALHVRSRSSAAGRSAPRGRRRTGSRRRSSASPAPRPRRGGCTT